MSENQRQLLIDINNISYTLGEEYAEIIKRVAMNLLDAKLLEVMPKLDLTELDELDTTEKLMLLREYSLTDEEREKERADAIPLEDILKEEGISIDDLQD